MGLLPERQISISQPKVRLGDPHVCSDDRDDLSILSAMYEPLVRPGRGGRHEPALAEQWALEDDARTWQFRLRSGIRCHNADLLSAQDVIASLQRVCEPTMGGELGTQGVYRGYLSSASLEAVGADIVRIVTGEPMADLLDVLAALPIVPRRALAKLPAVPVGTGPYRLVERATAHIIMQAFSEYWGGRRPVERVHWRGEPEARVRAEDLLAGRADVIAQLSPTETRLIKDVPDFQVAQAESSVCTVFMCNAREGICTDRRVRQALNLALNVPEIIRTVMQGAAVPLNGPLTSLHLGHDPCVSAYGYDPDRAASLLAEAGYSGGVELVLDVPSTLPDEAPLLAWKMAEDYTRIGIKTVVREFSDRPAYADMVRAKRIDDACCFDSSPLSTYRVLSEKFHSELEGPWWQGYTNEEVDSLINTARATPAEAARQEAYRRAYRVIRNDAPWVFLYNPILFWGVGPRARSWRPSIDGLIGLV